MDPRIKQGMQNLANAFFLLGGGDAQTLCMRIPSLYFTGQMADDTHIQTKPLTLLCVCTHTLMLHALELHILTRRFIKIGVGITTPQFWKRCGNLVDPVIFSSFSVQLIMYCVVYLKLLVP